MTVDGQRRGSRSSPWQQAASGFVELPLLRRWAVGGATLAGFFGAVAGLVVGLFVHPPTAWFAVFELGIPAALAGGVIGLVGGLMVQAWFRIRRRPERRGQVS